LEGRLGRVPAGPAVEIPLEAQHPRGAAALRDIRHRPGVLLLDGGGGRDGTSSRRLHDARDGTRSDRDTRVAVAVGPPGRPTMSPGGGGGEGGPGFPADIALIALPTPFEVGDVNAYLLKGEPLTLLDPGPQTDEAWRALVAGLKQHRTRPEDIELIVLTH